MKRLKHNELVTETNGDLWVVNGNNGLGELLAKEIHGKWLIGGPDFSRLDSADKDRVPEGRMLSVSIDGIDHTNYLDYVARSARLDAARDFYQYAVNMESQCRHSRIYKRTPTTSGAA